MPICSGGNDETTTDMTFVYCTLCTSTPFQGVPPGRSTQALAGLTLLRAVVYDTFPPPENRLSMKLIIAIIQPSRLEAVKAALSEVEVFRLTIMDVQGFGRQKGHAEVFRGHEVAVNLLRKVQLQIAVNEEFVEPTINAIIKGGRTGKTGEIGDGKIFVLPLEDCIRIRTGERGKEAI
jgi:nitrogen regulatory protein P-II 2